MSPLYALPVILITGITASAFLSDTVSSDDMDKVGKELKIITDSANIRAEQYAKVTGIPKHHLLPFDQPSHDEIDNTIDRSKALLSSEKVRTGKILSDTQAVLNQLTKAQSEGQQLREEDILTTLETAIYQYE